MTSLRARHTTREEDTHSRNSFLVSSSLFFLNSAGVMCCPMAIMDGSGAFGGGGGTFSLRALPTAVEAWGALSLLAGVMGGLQGVGQYSAAAVLTQPNTAQCSPTTRTAWGAAGAPGGLFGD